MARQPPARELLIGRVVAGALSRVVFVTLEHACIAPHGDELIPKLASRRQGLKFGPTREGMRILSKRIADAKPDAIVIASPHNLRLWRHIGIVLSQHSSGTLRKARSSAHVNLSVDCDRKFANEILKASTDKGLPVVGANYGTSGGTSSDVPMDWGTLVPLWFPFEEEGLRSKVVIVTPSREIPLEQNFKFGTVIAELMRRKRGRYVFIASADQAHAHSKSGPYGFSRAAPKYDNLVCRAIENDDLRSILKFPTKLVDAAKPDSLWQMVILAGVLENATFVPTLVSYQVPTYYGMICASFNRIR